MSSYYWKTFLNLLINNSVFLSLFVSRCACLSPSLGFIPVHSMPPKSQTQIHTARGYLQTTMVERTRGDGLLTIRVQAVHVTPGG